MINKEHAAAQPKRSPWWRNIQSPLARKQLAAILLFSSIITLIGTAIQVYIEYRNDRNFVEFQLDQIGAEHLVSLTNSLWKLDNNQIKIQLNGMLSMHDIVHLIIRDEDDLIYAHAGATPTKPAIQRSYPMVFNHHGDLKTIGVLKVYASLENVYSSLLNRVFIILATQGLKTFLVSLFILFIIHQLVIRYLIRISDFAQTLRLDVLGSRLRLGRKASKGAPPDELDLVCIAINDMQQRLADDIEALKQAKEALEESEQKYRTLVHTIPLGVQLTDLDGKIIYSNPAHHNIQGFDTEELIGKNIWDLVANGADKQATKSYYRMLIEEQPPPTTYYNQDKTKDGRLIDTQINWDYLRDANGQMQGIISIISDISHRKKIDAELRQARKLESLGTLTGGIAHDFNNILGIIIGNTELALDNIPEWHAAHNNLAQIKSAGLRAAGIVKQLLSFTQKTEEELKPTDVVPIVEDIVKIMRTSLPPAIDIETHIMVEHTTILSAPEQIHRLIMNVCVNASHAMESTGGILHIGIDNHTLAQTTLIALTKLAPGEYVKITISDTGHGMEASILDKVFDPYFTTKDVGKGSGMGLAVAHGIVKNHNGAITVHSRPGHGATFTIFLPISRAMPESSSLPADQSKPGNASILLVDDEPSMVNMVAQMLEGLGYTVNARVDPNEALTDFQSAPEKYDLVITDMTMPQMTGTALSEKLLGIRKDLPIILCTGHNAMISAEEAMAMGIAAFLMKPIVTDELAKTIHRVLDGARHPTEASSL